MDPVPIADGRYALYADAHSTACVDLRPRLPKHVDASFSGATTTNKNHKNKKRPRLMFSTTVTYARMIIELLIAIFVTGLLAALAGGGAFLISQLVHFGQS